MEHFSASAEITALSPHVKDDNSESILAIVGEYQVLYCDNITASSIILYNTVPGMCVNVRLYAPQSSVIGFEMTSSFLPDLVPINNINNTM